MKNYLLIFSISIALFSSTTGCKNNDDVSPLSMSTQEKEDLLFMLEEEKLARDTYGYLDSLWTVSQFANIKNSEQSHMNAIISLLDRYNISYVLLPQGEFANRQLQDLYDQFVADGQTDLISALKIGATIEDLDIVDLENRTDATSNTDIISVYQNLQCGSRNHLRSFVTAVTNQGGSYEPQFLSVSEFDGIINGSHEQCK